MWDDPLDQFDVHSILAAAFSGFRYQLGGSTSLIADPLNAVIESLAQVEVICKLQSIRKDSPGARVRASSQNSLGLLLVLFSFGQTIVLFTYHA
ncbi:hypothetical protein EJB05_08512, partial [Eragrostis curvula]